MPNYKETFNQPWLRPVQDHPLTFGTFDVAAQPKAIDAAKRMAEDIILRGHARSLVLWGPLGTGKTHLACAVHEAVGRALGPANGGLFIRLNTCTLMIRVSYSDGYTGPHELDLIEGWCGEPLLVLDDVGREPKTEFTERTAFEIISGRYDQNLPILVTTNLNPDALSKHIGAGAVSRLVGMGDFVETTGDDWRRR